MYSVKSSSVEAALAMLSYSKVDVNLRNDQQGTALMYACQKKSSRRRPRHARQERNLDQSPGPNR